MDFGNTLISDETIAGFVKTNLKNRYRAAFAMLRRVRCLLLSHASHNRFRNKMSTLEHYFNIPRHIQHHVGQLADRVRNACDVGVEWVGGKSAQAK